MGAIEATLQQISQNYLDDAVRQALGLDNYSPLQVRVLDSVFDGGTGDPAVFIQREHGAPFMLAGAAVQVPKNVWRHGDTANDAIPTDTTVLYPDYNYPTFE